MKSHRLAVYTTVYPGVERYLSAWYQSVLLQTDCNFDLWIGVDLLSTDQVIAALGEKPRATFVKGKRGDSPAQIRQKAIARIVEEYIAVIFVDSDDLLYPFRVEAARETLTTHDVVACAMSIVDEEGRDLGITFGSSITEELGVLLPRYNIFGLSNTAYRSEILRRCISFPAECVLIDWYLATKAWDRGAKMYFDTSPRMKYRQYAANLASVLPPFTAKQILEATQRVQSHYRYMLATDGELSAAHQYTLQLARDRIDLFHKSITGSAGTLDIYLKALNQLPPRYIWWWSVAHPELEGIWKI